jgi:hypothetical protein
MTNRFQKVDEPQGDCVTVSLYEVDGVVRGDASGPTQWNSGSLVTEITRQDGSLTAEQAVASGISLANRLGVVMVVVDPHNLWDTAWGELWPG